MHCQSTGAPAPLLALQDRLKLPCLHAGRRPLRPGPAAVWLAREGGRRDLQVAHLPKCCVPPAGKAAMQAVLVPSSSCQGCCAGNADTNALPGMQERQLGRHSRAFRLLSVQAMQPLQAGLTPVSTGRAGRCPRPPGCATTTRTAGALSGRAPRASTACARTTTSWCPCTRRTRASTWCRRLRTRATSACCCASRWTRRTASTSSPTTVRPAPLASWWSALEQNPQVDVGDIMMRRLRAALEGY